MTRRDFIQQSTVGAMALTMPDLPFLKGENRMGIVIHSYAFRYGSKVESKNFPAFNNTIDLLEHSAQIGAGGIQATFGDWKDGYAKSVREKSEKLGLYVEGSIPVPKNVGEVEKFEQNIKNAKEAGMKVVRCVCSGGRRYEILKTQAGFDEMYKNAIVSLQLAEPILKKYKIKLGVENHKDWRTDEHIELIKKISSEWVGITLDFGNNMALLEEPMTVIEKLAPYAFTTHIKDMAVEDYKNGFLLSEVPMGMGISDLPKMVEICKKYNPNITFNLEMITRDPLEIPCFTNDYWATFSKVSGNELAKILKESKENKFDKALPRVSQLNAEEKLKVEEDNILECINYSKNRLGMK
jgi:3-oxoisoapionate decarboxylase